MVDITTPKHARLHDPILDRNAGEFFLHFEAYCGQWILMDYGTSPENMLADAEVPKNRRGIPLCESCLLELGLVDGKPTALGWQLEASDTRVKAEIAASHHRDFRTAARLAFDSVMQELRAIAVRQGTLYPLDSDLQRIADNLCAHQDNDFMIPMFESASALHRFGSGEDSTLSNFDSVFRDALALALFLRPYSD